MADDDKKVVADEPVEKSKTDEAPADEAPAEEPASPAPAPTDEAAAPAAPAPASAGTDAQGRQLYDVKCSECGKDTQVPFKPSGDRPVYCRDCYMKRRGR